jgi:hypothetical protein
MSRQVFLNDLSILNEEVSSSLKYKGKMLIDGMEKQRS